MAKSDETRPDESTPWGTWEELLLASAVNRYGTKSWDSVAVEIRKRSSVSITLSPHNCKSKYLDLKRRFRSAADSDTNADAGDTVVPWLDELRKIRVSELERELQRYDLSIVSLQMKVKRLTEEREKGGGEKSDLEKCEDIVKNEVNEPATVQGAGKLESDGDNQSVNESNENLQTGEVILEENEKIPVRTGEGGTEPKSCSPVRENSCNSSSNSKPVSEVKVEIEPEGDVSESANLQDNSDVQSSASKSRKEGNDTLHCTSRKCDGASGEGDQSPPAMKGNQNQPVGGIVKLQPLVDLLRIVRSHKLGSVFERRLESQEKLRYNNLIRQHINLKILQTRLDEGCYSDGNDSFFRDVLLLVNNGLVFFSKTSPESVAAIELRQIISKEMAKIRRNKPTDSSDEKQLSTPVPLPPKRDPELLDSLLPKPKVAGPMIVCRKRSSITAKASTSTSGADQKKEPKAALAEEKQVLDMKQPDKSSEEHRITEKRTREAFPATNNKKVRADTNTKKTSEVMFSQNQRKGGSPGEQAETKSEKKKKCPVGSDVKKQGATNFLNRMRRSSTPSDGSLLNTFKSSVDDDSENDIRGEQKAGSNRGDGRKDQSPKMSSVVRQQDSTAKRRLGRPPKRAAAPTPKKRSRK